MGSSIYDSDILVLRATQIVGPTPSPTPEPSPSPSGGDADGNTSSALAKRAIQAYKLKT